jgi:hypothetical protein
MSLPGFGGFPVRLGHRFGQPATGEIIERPAPEVRHAACLGTVADLVADLAQPLVDVAHVVDALCVGQAAQPGLAQTHALEDEAHESEVRMAQRTVARQQRRRAAVRPPARLLLFHPIARRVVDHVGVDAGVGCKQRVAHGRFFPHSADARRRDGSTHGA